MIQRRTRLCHGVTPTTASSCGTPLSSLVFFFPPISPTTISTASSVSLIPMYVFICIVYITLYVRIYHHFFNCQYPLIKFLHFFYDITCMTIYEILHTPHPWKSLRFFLAFFVGVQRASTRWNICLSFPLFLMS